MKREKFLTAIIEEFHRASETDCCIYVYIHLKGKGNNKRQIWYDKRNKHYCSEEAGGMNKDIKVICNLVYDYFESHGLEIKYIDSE